MGVGVYCVNVIGSIVRPLQRLQRAERHRAAPDFVERGIVRLLDGLYLDVAGPTTPILTCPC
jgi:hypothetical protein